MNVWILSWEYELVEDADRLRVHILLPRYPHLVRECRLLAWTH